MIGKENDPKPLSLNNHKRRSSATDADKASFLTPTCNRSLHDESHAGVHSASFAKQGRLDSKLSPHVHDEESLKRIINRLSRIEGHVRGIKTMVRENRPCPEVLNQVAAVKGAISGVAKIILEEHLEECLVRAANQGNLEAEIKALKDALNLFTS